MPWGSCLFAIKYHVLTNISFRQQLMELGIFYVISTSIMQYGPHQELIFLVCVWGRKQKDNLTLDSEGFLYVTPVLCRFWL